MDIYQKGNYTVPKNEPPVNDAVCDIDVHRKGNYKVPGNETPRQRRRVHWTQRDICTEETA
jgi:hypothetical protein